MLALIAAGDDDEAGDPSVLASIRSDVGNVSLNTMLTEIAKFEAVHAVGLPDYVLADVTPNIVTARRGRRIAPCWKREGLKDMGELAISGEETQVRRQLRRLAEIGVTDFVASRIALAGDPDAYDRTCCLLADVARRGLG